MDNQIIKLLQFKSLGTSNYFCIISALNPTTLLNNTYQVRAGVFFYATNKRDGSGLEFHLSFLTGFRKCAASSAE
jgi:hypothetical protein